MSKVIQWYVDNIQNPETDVELSNYFPWNCMYKKGIQSVMRNLHKNKDEGSFGRYTFRSDKVHHSWRNFKNETEIKFITKNSNDYVSNNINIFPIRFLANEDQIFANPHLCPFANLPNETLQWLRDHPDCTIVLHDPHEAKAISDELFTTIPALIVKRKHYKLENKFVFLDSRANPEVLTQYSDYFIPKWLHFVGANHWVQFASHTMSYENIEVIKSNSKKEPLFDQGRFLMYGGRFRPTRYFITNQVLKSVPREQLWLRLAKRKNSDTINEYIINPVKHSNYENSKRNIKNPFNDNDCEDFINLYKQTPIDTFPKNLKEDGTDYENYKFFWLPNPNHYSKVFVDISCETYNERSGRHSKDIFLTEKVCKPLWAGRPFITSANPGFYNELKKLGFKTFDKWWDESFAEDCDTKTHAKRLLDTIKYVSSLTKEQCREMYHDMLPTLQHNQKTIEQLSYTSPRLWIQEIKQLRHNGLI